MFPHPTQLLLFPSIYYQSDTTQTFLRVLIIKVPQPGLMKTLQFHFRLLVTINHEYPLKAVMYVTNGTHIYHTSTTIYNVPNRKILEIETTLEYIQKQWDTPLIESYN